MASSCQAELPQKQMFATLTNQTQTELLRYLSTLGFPQTIPSGGVSNIKGFESKGIVKYEELVVGRTPVAFILAWDSPATIPGAKNKVYVTCGSKKNIDEMTTEQILKNLDASSDESRHIDPLTRSAVSANIRGLITTNPGLDVGITANFGALVI